MRPRRLAVVASIVVVIAVTIGLASEISPRPARVDQIVTRQVACQEPGASYACGVAEISVDNVTLDVNYIVDGPSAAPLVVWLPGGPNEYATPVCLANRAVLGPKYPGMRFLVVDPPRQSDGDWAMASCLTSSEQARFFGGLASPPGARTAQAAKSLVEACSGSPGVDYGAPEEARVIEAIVKGLPETAGNVQIYATSADARVAALLANMTLGADSLILDSPLTTSRDGVRFVGSQASRLSQRLDEIGSLVSATTGPGFGSDADAALYRISLARTPGLSTADAATALESADQSVVYGVSDQYSRRYGDDQYSPLNGLFFAGLCQAFDWPVESKYLAEATDAVRADPANGVVVGAIFNFYLPCVYWPTDEASTAGRATKTDVPVTILASASDPVVGDTSAEWLAKAQKGVAYVFDGPGHDSLLARTPCTAIELVSSVQRSTDCTSALAVASITSEGG